MHEGRRNAAFQTGLYVLWHDERGCIGCTFALVSTRPRNSFFKYSTSMEEKPTGSYTIDGHTIYSSLILREISAREEPENADGLDKYVYDSVYLAAK